MPRPDSKRHDGQEFRFHYGPTADDPDRGKRWHNDCGGEVWIIDGGYICSKCDQQEEIPGDDG